MKDVTSREAEILGILKKEPMISQEELAERLQISRSAVAVHISNLIKKRLILGRGYVFNDRLGVNVCGAVYSHTIADTGNEINSGKVTENIGGISFFTACQLAEFVPFVRFFGTVGRDEKGEKIVSLLHKAGVDTSYISREARFPTAHRVDLCHSGRLERKVFDQRIWESGFREIINGKIDVIKTAELIVTDHLFYSDLIKKINSEPFTDDFKICLIIDGEMSLLKMADYPCSVNVFVVSLGALHEPVPQAFSQYSIISYIPGEGVRIKIQNRQETVPFLPGQFAELNRPFPPFCAGLISGIYKNLTLRQSVRLAMSCCNSRDSQKWEKSK